MELPHLGVNCSHIECSKLDFLPVKCDACSKIFCKDHYPYTAHKCQSCHAKDNQVPVCPLCNRPVSILKHENVDEIVGRHIDNDCNSERALNNRKIYNKRCSMKNCKQKEMVQVNCSKCRLNYCLRHRNELDHNCKGFGGGGGSISNGGAAAISRLQNEKMSQKQNMSLKNNPQRITAMKIHSLQQPSMSEEEALQAALQLSMQNSNLSSEEKLKQEEEDAHLARILQESETAVIHQQQDTRIFATDERSSNCAIS